MPKIVFHLAAQPLVRQAYALPIETYETNVIGTLKLLEACRRSPSVVAVVNVTSDKCYENRGWIWPYRETDNLGGHDLYSSSKACSEIMTKSFRRSFLEGKSPDSILLASARAGNVIGGGDWAQDRLFPDIIRSILGCQVLKIRNPNAIRPWQHVLDCLNGYLRLGQKLLEGDDDAAAEWNFGPTDMCYATVHEIVDAVQQQWPEFQYEFDQSQDHLHESQLLRLDCSKAEQKLNWRSIWSLDETIEKTVRWYQHFHHTNNALTISDIASFSKAVKGCP